MSPYNDLILDDYYKLRIASKKLSSGRYQVKFFAVIQKKELYGYLLVSAEETLKSVIKKIRKRLKEIDLREDYRYIHLNNSTNEFLKEPNIMIFNNVTYS